MTDLVDQARAQLVRRWHDTGWYQDESLSSVLDHSSKRHPDAWFEYWGADRPVILSLRDLCQRGEAAAQGLAGLGLRLGDVLLAQVPNCPEGAVLFYAAMRLGLVIVPVIHIYGVAELDFIARDAGAKCAVLPTDYRNIDWHERARTLANVPTIEHIVGIGDGGVGDLAWDAVEHGDSVDLPNEAIDPDARCLVVYTSGTTAAPKGAQHTHNSLLSEIRSTGRAFSRSSHAPALQAQPAGHLAGLLGLLRSIYEGTQRTIMLDTWDAALAAKVIQDAGIVRTTGPPFFLTTLLDVADAEGIKLPQLSDYMTGGERVPVPLIERADRTGIGAYRCYGSTEHPTVTTSLPSDSFAMRAHTDGRSLPGNAIRIVDESGNDLPLGVHGQVLTIGPDQFAGYTDKALNQACFESDGWFRTGDIGRLDHGGILTITDRLKDIIIRGGENISSREVEEILLRHSAVKDVAVIALPDRRYGERACAVVTLVADASLDLPTVREHFAQAGVARQKTPEWLEIVEAFPRTAVGKIKKNVLRAQITAPATWNEPHAS